VFLPAQPKRFEAIQHRDADTILQRFAVGTQSNPRQRDGREGCNNRSQQSSDYSVTALQVPDGSSDEDRGRCLVGVIVVGCCCENEEDVRGDPEKREGEDGSSDGAVERPEVQRQGTSEQRQGELKRPYSFPRLSLFFSAAEPPRFRRYRTTHCFPSIERNAADSGVATGL